MGMHADAKLVFGVDLGEDGLQLGGDEDDARELDDLLAEHAGLVRPTLPPDGHALYHGYDSAAWEAWKAAAPEAWSRFDRADDEWRAAKRKLAEEAPVEIVRYGYFDGYSCEVLALKGTTTVAWEYGCVKVDPSSFVVPQLAAILRAKAFCAEHGLPAFEPSWLLAACYG